MRLGYPCSTQLRGAAKISSGKVVKAITGTEAGGGAWPAAVALACATPDSQYERAAEAPSSESSAHHALLYDLATALEANGENVRALAVFLELQAEAGDYRDLPAKLEHLTAELRG